jgi:hypothetical protein
VRNHSAITMLALTVLVATLATGCSGLLFVGGPEAEPISFEAGELRSTEQATLAELDSASRAAIEAIGCDIVDVQRETEQIRWQARTAGGDPVDVLLIATSTKQTELRIRIGVLGDETRSRLVLEEIQQSLAAEALADQEQSQAH